MSVSPLLADYLRWWENGSPHLAALTTPDLHSLLQDLLSNSDVTRALYRIPDEDTYNAGWDDGYAAAVAVMAVLGEPKGQKVKAQKVKAP